MIANAAEYEKAQEELKYLEEWLARLQQSQPVALIGFTKAGIRKMIARLHEELAVYEASDNVRRSRKQDGYESSGIQGER